jgi:c-di-GMP-binding flagellar brake protein YcgR
MIECREDPRVSVELPVSFSAIGQIHLRQGTMFDISSGGCAVISPVSVKPGIGLTLWIRAAELGSPITVHSAEVRWADHGEFGVEFLNLTDVDRSRLHRFLHLTAQRPTPQH